jgi:hypothetical protein
MRGRHSAALLGNGSARRGAPRPPRPAPARGPRACSRTPAARLAAAARTQTVSARGPRHRACLDGLRAVVELCVHGDGLCTRRKREDKRARQLNARSARDPQPQQPFVPRKTAMRSCTLNDAREDTRRTPGRLSAASSACARSAAEPELNPARHTAWRARYPQRLWQTRGRAEETGALHEERCTRTLPVSRRAERRRRGAAAGAPGEFRTSRLSDTALSRASSAAE